MPLLSMPRRLRMPHQSSEHKQDKQDDQDDEQDSAFECNICLEVAKDAVVSMCGHLFCWTCLYRWLDEIDSESMSSTKSCPVCRSVVTLDRIIPIYGRGGDTNNHNDPRHRLHPRPPGLRTEVSYPQEQIYQINILPIEHPRPEIFGYGFHLTIGFGSLFGYMLLLFYLTKRIEKV